MSKQASDFKGMVILSAFLAPVLAGAIIYYSLRKSHEAIASLGNNISFLAFVLWVAVPVVLSQAGIHLPKLLYLITLLTGIVLAIITVYRIQSEC